MMYNTLCSCSKVSQSLFDYICGNEEYQNITGTIAFLTLPAIRFIDNDFCMFIIKSAGQRNSINLTIQLINAD